MQPPVYTQTRRDPSFHSFPLLPPHLFKFPRADSPRICVVARRAGEYCALAPTNESERHRREKARTESGLSRSKHRRQCNSHGKGGREVPKSRLRQEPKKKSQTLKYETCLFIQNIFVSETGFEFFNLRPLLPLLGAPLRSSLVLLPGIPYESSGREGKQAKILVGQKRR